VEYITCGATNNESDEVRIPAPTVGVANIAFPQQMFRSSVRWGRMTWPLTRVSRMTSEDVPAEAYGVNPTTQTSVSRIPLSRGETELHQTSTEFRDEVDAYVEQERRDWLEELV
jgi:hypothetical protein